MPAFPVAGRQVSTDPRYSLPMPPLGGFTADDLDRIPDLPPHTEPIHGSLVPVAPQRSSRTFVLPLLGRTLYERHRNTSRSAGRWPSASDGAGAPSRIWWSRTHRP